LIVLGVDPGTIITGYGFVRLEDGKQVLLEYGCIRPPKKAALSDRYRIIYEDLDSLVKKFKPDAISVESQFMKNNFASVMKLGMAKAMVLLAGSCNQIPIYEYSPTKAKKAVVGNGRASKLQVQRMIQLLLNLPSLPEPEDAADALSLAVCHLNTCNSHLECGERI